MADLGARGTSPGSKFFQFHAVSGEFGKIVGLSPAPQGWRPTSGESWIRHWNIQMILNFKKNYMKLTDQDYSVLQNLTQTGSGKLIT